MTLRPFFSYYGSKWRLAPHYPKPVHDTIVEPFAGSAGYALHYPDRNVVLYDANPLIVSVWQYLIRASRDEVEALPATIHAETLSRLCAPARWLIGFWLCKASASPRAAPSAWMRQTLLDPERANRALVWGPAVRSRIATQVSYIRHWKVRLRSYADIKGEPATWFVDPPYSGRPGFHYRRWGSKHVDYTHLAKWCENLPGQVIVCERADASWLPFVPLREARSGSGNTYTEAVWVAGTSP